MTIEFEAMLFARYVHRNQRRKYTNNPYTDHLAEVAGIVATVYVATVYGASDYRVLPVCWLHDCMEDQGVPWTMLRERFGEEIANGVLILSDIEKGNRKDRKQAARDRLSKAPGWVQTIKVADLISNTSSIVEHDPKFAVTYLEEKRLLLDVLKLADERLVKIAREQTK